MLLATLLIELLSTIHVHSQQLVIEDHEEATCPPTKDCKVAARADMYTNVGTLKHFVNRTYVGWIQFEQIYGGNDVVTVTGHIVGLTPGHHGLHVHTYGSGDCQELNTNTHYNPTKTLATLIIVDFTTVHGGVKNNQKHLGDLGNIKAGPSGTADFKIKDTGVQLYGKHSVIGRSIMVHVNIDDLSTNLNDQSIIDGNAGAAFACGIIGVQTRNFNPMGGSQDVKYSLSLSALMFSVCIAYSI